MSGLTPEQIKARLGRITATRAAMIALGDDHPYGGARAAYIDAIGEGEPDDRAILRGGNYFEAGVLRWYADDTGHKLTSGTTWPCRLRDKEWAACTPDAYVDEPATGPAGLVQAKLVNRKLDEWGDVGTLLIPDHVRIQTQWEMNVTVRAWDDVAACFGGAELRIYHIEHDAELGGYLWQICEKFYRDHIVPRVPPPPDGTPASAAWIRRRYPKDNGTIVTATPEVALAVEVYSRARAQEREASEAKERMAQVIQEFMGDATALAIPGQPHGVTWKANRSGGSDHKGMAALLLAKVATEEKWTADERRKFEDQFKRPGARVLRVPNNEGGSDE